MNLKNILRRSTAILIAIYLVLGNFIVAGVGISEVLAEEIIYTPNVKIEAEFTKYNQYNNTSDKGAEIQTNIKIKETSEYSKHLAFKSMQLNIQVPTIGGIKPDSVNVNTTLRSEFRNKSVTKNYNKEAGSVTISYSDNNTSDYSTSTYAEDIFVVTYVYPISVRNVSEKSISSEIKASALYKGASRALEPKITIRASGPEYIGEEEKIDGNSVEYAFKQATDIYKGYMYSNEKNETNYTTDYKVNSELNIINKDSIDGLKIELNKSKFGLQNNTELNTNTIEYKATKISEEDFSRIFGQSGYIDFKIGEENYATIKFVDENGNKKFTTQYYTQSKENIEAGKVEYPEKTLEVKIETSKPIANGNAIFESEKRIIAEKDYESTVSGLKNIIEVRKIDDSSEDIKGSINLKEPTTQMSLELDKNQLSTLTTNNIVATLKIDNTNSSCKLMEAGLIEITLPQNLSSAEITNARSLYENGIQIRNAKIENGKVILEVIGEQTTYATTNIFGGVNIVLNLSIKIDNMTPTHKENIVARYSGAEVSKELQINSLGDVLMLTKTTGFTQDDEITTVNSETKSVELANKTEAKEVKQTINIVNNTENDITNAKIVGRIENNDATLATNLTRAINVNIQNAKIYYSNNKDAAYDDNSWTEQYTNTAKAYKIELNNNILEKKSALTINLFMQIPANLGGNKNIDLKTQLQYLYNGENKNSVSSINMYTADSEIMNEDNESKNQNENIEVSVVPCITENYAHAGQRILYRIKVKNISNQTLNNINVQETIPDNAIYTYNETKIGTGSYYLEEVKDETRKNIAWEIESLLPGAEQKIEFMITINNNITQQQEIVNSVKVIHNSQEVIANNSLVVKPGLIAVNLTTSSESFIDKCYTDGENIEFYINVKNISNNTINNAKVQYMIPRNIKLITGGLGKYHDILTGYTIEDEGTLLSNNIFEYNISKLNKNEEKTIVLKCSVERLSIVNEANVSGIANVILNDDIYQTVVKTINIKQADFNVTLQSNKSESQTLKKGDEVIYTVTIKNIGETFGSFSIIDEIPSQIKVKKFEYLKLNGESFSMLTSKQKVEISNSLSKEEILTVKIYGEIDEITTDNEETIKVNNMATLINGEYQKNSNIVALKVKTEKKSTTDDPTTPDNSNIPYTPNIPDDSKDPSNPTTPDNPGTPQNIKYSISGIAWLDSNKDGKRDEGEKLLSGIKVYLVNSETGKMVTDEKGADITVITNEKGGYKFENISKGNYIVIFEFDTNTYKTTRYQVAGIESAINSDAVISKVTINGQEKKIGATNVLELKSDLNNINIGLIENAKSDLSLEKQISKIQTINPLGTKTVEYRNTNLAKVDLVAKYMNETSVIVTYKFIIKNNGDITGYVDSLQDNMPKGLEFSSELNKEWYIGSDGNLYTSALSGIAIEPGKQSEIELILTKDTNDESTGTFTNNAQLAKVSNIEAVEESVIDNNKSSANLVLSIHTGSPFLYIGITIGSITIIVTGAYIIKKKILDREVLRKGGK